MSQDQKPAKDPMYAAAAIRVCPYLGLYEDPASRFSYPNAGNYCHTEEQPLSVEPRYQSGTCFGGNWLACPRYRPVPVSGTVPRFAAALQPVPKGRGGRSRWILAGAAVLIVALLFGLFFLLRPLILGPGSPLSGSLAVLEPSATATATAPIEALSPTATPTPPASPTVQASSTPPPPSPTPTPTPSPTATPSPTLTPTATATVTPRPTVPAPTPAQPSAEIRFSAPVLLAPPNDHVFLLIDPTILSWQPVGPLGESAFYVITLAYSHERDTWYDESPWIKESSWDLNEHRYLLDLSDDGRFTWSVQVMRQKGVDASGRPVGIPLSPPSETRTFHWREQ